MKVELTLTIAIVGGLLLLVNMGPGGLSVDEKKKVYLGLRTRTVFYGLRYVTVRAVTVTYGSLEQRFYGRFHTGRNRIRSIGYVPYTAAYGIRLFLS